MTLGTNASLEERIIYAPDEVNPNEIFSALQELAEWRLLGDTPGDVKEQIEDLEKEVSKKDKEAGKYEFQIGQLEIQVKNLTGEILLLKDEVDYLKHLADEMGEQE